MALSEICFTYFLSACPTGCKRNKNTTGMISLFSDQLVLVSRRSLLSLFSDLLVFSRAVTQRLWEGLFQKVSDFLMEVWRRKRRESESESERYVREFLRRV